MAIPVQMPQPGNTVEECILVNWTRRQGDQVSAGEILAEIETDKANFEIESPATGTLLEMFFEAGALVPVLTNIAVIGEPGEPVEGFRPKPGPTAAAVPPASPAGVVRQDMGAGEPRGSSVAPGPAPGSPPPPPAPVLSPRARRFAARHGLRPEPAAGSGPGGRVLEADLRDLYERSPRVSSLARAMLEEGYRIRGEGSGLNRMVRAADLTPPPVRMSGIRVTIARRMRESLATTAQYTMHASAAADGLLGVRARLKARGGAAADININDLVMYCTARTLQEFPDLNAELIEGEIYRHGAIHLAFACDTARGLVVPVVQHCETLTLEDLSARIHLLTEQAVAGSLSPDDMTGGTFTVSNLGSLGIEAFTPIVNPPQVAILGVDAIQLKPVRRNGAVEFADFIGFSLTCDHQAVDGAPGARFLRRLRENVENVAALAGLGEKDD